MSGLLAGLESLGLGNLENMSLYETPEKEEQKASEKKEEKVEEVLEEQDFLFDKSYTCPVCDADFKAKTVRIGKAKLIGSDTDLRPRYEHVDLIKYDAILCPHCGYAALSRFFKYVTSSQMRAIKTNISQSFKPRTQTSEFYSYEEALEHYKMTLVNAIVKNAKPSEKAYICLKTAWLLRGQAEELDKEAEDYKAKKEAIDKQESEYMKNALEGFMAARQTELFPMCGMDEITVDYLISVLSMRFGQYDVAVRLLSGIILNKGTNARMRERAKDIKEALMKKIKQNA